MKNIAVVLTEKEIEALEISICTNKLKLEEKIDELKSHNRSGINTNLIKQKAERIQELDDLWDKLYTAEKLIK